MKKLLLLLFCFPTLIMAQAPQGFTYQGVATNNNGFELQNQTISIQASILSSSATGTAVWQETHTTTTDTFGLFSVVIGEGISTNSGSSAAFQEIDWGAASHFMKVEIDVNGGTNYVHVGTSQMMSVPYALYAENVHNLNMDSILGAVYDSIKSSNNGSITAGELCIDADTATVINFNLTSADGITGIEMDDSSNVYVSLSAMTHPNSGGYGGEIRKYDVDLNLIWTRSYSSYSPEKIIYRNGYLLVSGLQGWGADVFLSRLDPLNGSDIWNNTLSGTNYSAMEFNNNYVCIMHQNYGDIYSTFDLTDGSTIVSNVNIGGDGHQLRNYSGNTMLYRKRFSSSTTSYQYHTFDITQNNGSTFISGAFSPSSQGDFIYHQGAILDAYFTPSSGNPYFNNPVDGKFFIRNAGNSDELKVGNASSNYLANDGNGGVDLFSCHSNGHSLLIRFSNENVNLLGQSYIQNYTDNAGTAVLDFSTNGDLISVKNLPSLSTLEYPYIGASSSGKHCVGFKVENDICINGNNYSGIVLMIY